MCPSYPSAVVVPKNVEDSDLIAIANFRQAGRFPVLAYRHEGMVGFIGLQDKRIRWVFSLLIFHFRNYLYYPEFCVPLNIYFPI